MSKLLFKEERKSLIYAKSWKEIRSCAKKEKETIWSLKLENLEEEKKEYQNKRAKISDGNYKITEWIQMKRQSNDTISRESYKSSEDESQEDNMNIDIGMNKVTNPFTKR